MSKPTGPVVDYDSDANIIKYLQDMKSQNDSEIDQTERQIDTMRKKLDQ